MLQGDHGAWRRVLRLVGGDPESTRGTVAGDQKRPGLLGIMMGFVGLGNRFQPTKKSRMRWDRRRKNGSIMHISVQSTYATHTHDIR